jgi:hypothetical protein
MTAAAIFVGAVMGLALGGVGLSIVGLIYVNSMDATGRSESGRKGCRRDAGLAGCQRKGSRPAEPDRETLLRVFRETGWIDIDTARRFSK